MKIILTLTLIFWSFLINAQFRNFVDIPKVDGELSTISLNRSSLTLKPKTNCTAIESFSFVSSKSIYLNSNFEISKKSKIVTMQPIEITLKIDKSMTEWHERIFKGNVLPVLDLYVDKTSQGGTIEIVHIKLFNVRITEVMYVSSFTVPVLRVLLNYEKIIHAASKFSSADAIISVNQTCFDVNNGVECTDKL